MSVFLIIFLSTIVLVVVSVTVAMARRLDRLHQTVVKSRRALELALRARAEYARGYALSGNMDFAAAIVLTDAAEACISFGMQPIINDGLDKVDILNSTNALNDRRNLESALSRALRLTVDDTIEENSQETQYEKQSNAVRLGNFVSGDVKIELLDGDERGQEGRQKPLFVTDNSDSDRNACGTSGLQDRNVCSIFAQGKTGDGRNEKDEKLELLERARLDVRLTRTFHNSHVDQIRRLRRSAWVRLFHLAGGAPMPITVDIDDE